MGVGQVRKIGKKSGIKSGKRESATGIARGCASAARAASRLLRLPDPARTRDHARPDMSLGGADAV